MKEKEIVAKRKFMELLNEEIKKLTRYVGGPEVKDIGHDTRDRICWHFHTPYDSTQVNVQLRDEHSKVIEKALSIVEQEYEFE